MSEQKSQPIVFLKSNRVILRPVLKEDIPSLTKWVNDPEILPFLGRYLPVMEADEEEWFNNLHKRKPNHIVLAIIADEKIIGTMGLHRISMKDRVATTGALIGEKDYWGKGYGSEAKMILLDYAFNTLNLRKICSFVIAFNERSYKYSLKCGYKEEGRQRKHIYRFGKYWDQIFLAVFKEDWLPLWKEFSKEHNITNL
ncbi:MAG: GNAT family protein [Patescibacteria group bacterium]|nr:GNAT family protein [Patescibacteria group bacterium]